ncbi:MAG: RDD family protein [Gammaproteobacteria bacterium]|nr:RDD family protein [Gammaproteobacteria bacterium]
MSREVRYAGFWRRLAASLIDTLLLIIVLTPLVLLFSKGAYFPGLDPRGDIMAQLAVLKFDWSYLLLEDLLPMLLVIFFWVRFRATPGKQLMGCEVVDAATHGNLRIGQSVLRYLGYFLSLLPLGLGFLWIIWDRKKRGFHDLLAHTVVIMVEPGRDNLSGQSLAKLMKEVK